MLFRILWAALLINVLSIQWTYAENLTWALYEDPCDRQAAGSALRIEAGDYGVFFFDAPTIVGCTLISGCTEQLRVYPRPAPSPQDGLAECLDSSGCHLDILDVEEPWNHVLDFAGAHALMTTSIVLRASDPDIVVLFDPFEDKTPECESTNDADVLVQLAELAEAIDDDGIPPPLTLNMSFGRKYETDDAQDATCDPAGGRDCAGSLSCQIARLLAHIEHPSSAKSPRTVAIAAAGNHGDPMVFPAGLAGVTSVGMLDLTRFADDLSVVSAHETPANPDALMPGNGFCLQLASSRPAMPVFEAAGPAGSSLSAALFSGMASTLLWEHGAGMFAPLNAGPLWTPYQSCSDDSCSFVLQRGGIPYASQDLEGSRRIQEILEGDVSRCGKDESHLTVKATAVLTTDDPYAYDSLIDLVGSTHHPLPEPDPCVPCDLCCEAFQDRAFAGSRFGGVRRASGSVAGNQVTKIEMSLDLHSGWYFAPGLELTLLKLYLRVGKDLLWLKMASTDRVRISEGQVRLIKIRGSIARDLDWSEQPSLVALLRWDDSQSTQTRTVWDSTAVVFKN